MSINIEDVLLLKAKQDAVAREENGGAIAAGALMGGATGALMGSPRHSRGQSALTQRLYDRVQVPNLPQQNPLQKGRPGARMAGGLVGAILGGALGPGVKNMMTSESPAANILATLQTRGELTQAEERQLEEILSDTYNNITG